MNRTKLITLISLGMFLCFSSCQKSEEPYDAPIAYSSPNIRDFTISATLEADEEESTPRWVRKNLSHLNGRIYPAILWGNFVPASMVYLKKEGDPTIYRFRRPVLWKVMSLNDQEGHAVLWPYPDLTDMPLEYSYNQFPWIDRPNRYTDGKKAAYSMGGWELIHADDYKVPYRGSLKPVPKFQKGDKWYAIAVMARPAAFRAYSTRSQTVDVSVLFLPFDEMLMPQSTPPPLTLHHMTYKDTYFWQMSNWQEFTVAEDNTLHLKFDFKPVSPIVFVTVENQAQDFVFAKGDNGPYESVDFHLCFGTNNTMAGYYDLGAFNESTDVGKRAKWVPTKPLRRYMTIEEVRKIGGPGGPFPNSGMVMSLFFNKNSWQGFPFPKGSTRHAYVSLPTEMVFDSQLPKEERTLFIQPRSFDVLDPRTKKEGLLTPPSFLPLKDNFRYKIVMGNRESRVYSALESALLPITSSLIPGRYYQIKIVILPKE